jgi:GT2 family glycosyltransferase
MSSPPLATDPQPIRSVTVIVPTTGDPERLLPCLNSLLAQRCDAVVDVIAVVNGSRGRGVEIHLNGVRFVYEPAIGPAAARNRGVRESSSDCIAFIDDDCTASPLWLQAGLSRLQQAGARHVVAGAITRSGASHNWVSYFDSVKYLQQENYVKYSKACVTANLIMHRTTFERVGFFDETFREGACEDWEWATRASDHSVSLVFDASALVDHPCMTTLHQLRLKAQRLGRGELILRAKTDPRAAPLGLLSQVFRELRRSRARRHVRPSDRARLYCLDLWVALWMWDAARRLASRAEPT